MKIFIDIGHPAHVHFFKHLIWEMKNNGHEVVIAARSKEVTYSLLASYGFRFRKMISHRKSLLGKALTFPIRWIQTYKLCREINPDILIGIADFYSAQVGRILRRTSFIFTDTEHVKIDPLLTFPFADVILTPNCFSRNVSDKQIRYNGYHELAYLHPNYFNPDPSVLKMLDVIKGEKYIILRLVSWDASHDIGHSGLSFEMKQKLVIELSKYARVFISSEKKLPAKLKKYQINIPPVKMHDVLSFATLYIGEGATMASECAILGTPAIYINSLSAGTLEEQEKYGLLYCFRDSKGILEKALQLLKTSNLKKDYEIRRKKMLADKIDVTAFMVWFIENYPESVKIMNENPDY